MIAYLVLVHRYPNQFKRLFKAIYDPANAYLVHVDKNSDPAVEVEIRQFLAAYPNSAVMEGKKALWGGYSLVEAELRGMKQLLRMSPDWKFFINLSGQDFPLKNQSYIKEYLSKRLGNEFIKAVDQQKHRPDTMLRIQQYCTESDNAIHRTDIRREFLTGVAPYIGNQWMIVSRRFCAFVCDNPQMARYKQFYANTFIADEGFFQTVMMNTDAHGEIINDDLRTIDWIPEGDIKLRPRTYESKDAEHLIASPNLFARKFDEREDSNILSLLEGHLKSQAVLIPLFPTFDAAA